MGSNDAREQLEAAKAECVRLERELAAALAVIEKVRSWNTHDRCEPQFWDLHHVLATVDTAALAARDAEKWDEGAKAEASWKHVPPVNPYRASTRAVS